MRKDKYRYFKTVGQITYAIEEKEKEQLQINEQANSNKNSTDISDDMDLFMSLYDNNTGAEEIREANEMYNSYAEEDLYEQSKSKEYKNTDLYLGYEIDREMLVTAKEARTTTDKNQKFLVSKNSTFDNANNKKNKNNQSIITEADSVYKVSHKMRISGIAHQSSNKPIERIGFIEVTPQHSQFTSPAQLTKLTQQNKIIGMLEDNKPILKNKPFNTRKIGYLPVNISDTQHHMCQVQPNSQSNNTQQFVEVVEQRDIKWFVTIILLFILLAALLKTQDPADWKFNLSNLTLFKTAEQTTTAESSLQLSLNVSPTLKEENKEQNQYSLNINLSSPATEDKLTYIAVLTDTTSNTTIWTQDNILAGETIEQITISLTEDQTANQTIPCQLKVTIYKDGRYIGEMESSLTIYH